MIERRTTYASANAAVWTPCATSSIKTAIAAIASLALQSGGQQPKSFVLRHVDRPRLDPRPVFCDERIELLLLCPQQRVLRQLLLAFADEPRVHLVASKAEAEYVRSSREADDHTVLGDQHRLAIAVAERRRLARSRVHFLHPVAEIGMRRALDHPGRGRLRRCDSLRLQVPEHPAVQRI